MFKLDHKEQSLTDYRLSQEYCLGEKDVAEKSLLFILCTSSVRYFFIQPFHLLPKMLRKTPRTLSTHEIQMSVTNHFLGIIVTFSAFAESQTDQLQVPTQQRKVGVGSNNNKK